MSEEYERMMELREPLVRIADAAESIRDLLSADGLAVPTDRQWLETKILDSAVSRLDDLHKRLVVVEKLVFELNQRATQLTQIVLAIDPEACAKHDLLPF
jgi:hypothetical protein